MVDKAPEHFAVDEIPSVIDWSKFGWGIPGESFESKRVVEGTTLDQIAKATPDFVKQKTPREWQPEIKAKWDAFMQSKGYDAGSMDLTLLDEFVYGKRHYWLPQKTGSCTISNTGRPASRRHLVELILKGQLEELLGSTEFGPTSMAFYWPLTYGIGRQHINMRSGDGSYGAPTIWSMQQGILPCNNGKLNEILHGLGADGEKDYPEPQDNNVYRKFQNWTYNSVLKPFLVAPLTNSVPINTTDELEANAKAGIPTICCSGIAIRKSSTIDGLVTYELDPLNSWSHCMSWQGFIIWKGKVYDLLSNESWGPNIIYPIPREKTNLIFKKNLELYTLGEFDLPDTGFIT